MRDIAEAAGANLSDLVPWPHEVRTDSPCRVVISCLICLVVSCLLIWFCFGVDRGWIGGWVGVEWLDYVGLGYVFWFGRVLG